MRRALLAPAQPLKRLVADLPARPVAAPPEPPPRGRMGEASPARRRLRRLFDPAAGWFRRSERQASHWLTRHLYPRVPGLNVIYDWQLRRGLTLSETTISLPDLPPAFAGFRILLISDVHAGPFVSNRAVSETFDRLMTARPDAIVLVGDLTTSRLREFERSAWCYRRLKAPHGVFAVMGNHDHYTEDPPQLRRMIESAGLELLHNRSVALRRDGATLSLAGIDDWMSGQPDLDAALGSAASPVILLSHNPDVLFEAAAKSVALVLSGHTHAGQVRLPGLPVLVRQSRYRLDEGRYRYRSTELIVSRGLGAVGLPIRLVCSPEAVLVDLQNGSLSPHEPRR